MSELIICGWEVRRDVDPPFEDLMVLTNPVGEEEAFVRADDQHVWMFLATLVEQAKRLKEDTTP